MTKITEKDFQSTKKLLFNMDGSELTPSSKYDFKFKDYCPEVFRDLRSSFGIDPADYLVSITGKYILSELGSPGKSGSFFYYSRDYRFIIKTIRRSEHKQLRAVLKDYYDHVKENPNTLISQFYGLHRVKMPFKNGNRKVYFVVMNNLFPPHRDIHLKYDLKGSTWGRITRIDTKTDLSQVTLKDLNWLERREQINLGPNKRKQFLDQLEKDVALLKRINVMDYSLLLGVHDVKRGNTFELKLSVFDPKSSNKSELIRTNPRDIDREIDLPNQVFPGRTKFIFYGHDGGLRATNENNEPLSQIYYLGIIDCLTKYSCKKRLETAWRSFRNPRETISAVPAKEYGDRFLRFIAAGTSNFKQKVQ
jgi:1-phosphatidylinositol-4-phosphate 5-kinase